MKCPNCGVPAPAGATDCSGCGIIFAKFKKKLENLEAPVPTAPFNPWKGRAVALALVVLWFVGFAIYYRGVVAELRARQPDRPARRR